MFPLAQDLVHSTCVQRDLATARTGDPSSTLVGHHDIISSNGEDFKIVVGQFHTSMLPCYNIPVKQMSLTDSLR